MYPCSQHRKMHQDCFIYFSRLCVPTMCHSVQQALWFSVRVHSLSLSHTHTVPNTEEPEIITKSPTCKHPLTAKHYSSGM